MVAILTKLAILGINTGRDFLTLARWRKTMSSAFSVFFWMMRHGEKTGPQDDALSSFGRDQVRATTLEYLTKVRRDVAGIVYSETERTCISAKIVHINLGGGLRLEPQPCRSIGYHGLFDDPNIPSWDFAKLEDELMTERNNKPTVYDWLEKMPPAWGSRHAMRCWMLDKSKLLHRIHKKGSSLHVIGLSHDPICGLAAPRPREIGPIGTADIVRYEVKIVDGELTILQPTVLRCPLQR